MANNIPTQTEASPGSVPWKALVFSGVIFGISLMIYAGIAFGYKPFLTSSIDNIDAQISELDRVAPKKESEEEFIQFYSQVTNIRDLLSSHVSAMPFFDAIEKNTFSQVTFSDFLISVSAKMASVSGFAGSYNNLANQLAAYENTESVSSISLNTARLADEMVRFEATINLDDSMFDFQKRILIMESEESEEENESGEEAANNSTTEQ
jgi:hypothetical protein